MKTIIGIIFTLSLVLNGMLLVANWTLRENAITIQRIKCTHFADNHAIIREIAKNQGTLRSLRKQKMEVVDQIQTLHHMKQKAEEK